MNALASLKAKLLARSDTEHELALLRVMMLGLVLAFFTLFVGPRDGWSDVDLRIAIVLAVLFAIAIGIFASICVWPAANVWRRLIGMILDAGAATFYIWLAGAVGVMGIGMYLFIIFANGFRYGLRYSFVCQAFCLAGFTAALVAVPYWQQHLAEGLGLLITLIIVPIYVSVLVQRMQKARAETEQALKECLERAQRAV